VEPRNEKEKKLLSRLRAAKENGTDMNISDMVFYAIDKFLSNDFHEIQKQQIHFPTNSEFRADVETKIAAIRNRFSGRSQVRREELEDAIKEICGRNGEADKRTVKDYIERLRIKGIITGSKPAYKTVIYYLKEE